MNKDSKKISELLGLGIKQEELGKFLGITRQSVSKFALGNEPTRKVAERLSIFNDVPNETDKIILEIHNNLLLLESTIYDLKKDSKYEIISKAAEAMRYIAYWCEDKKFTVNREEFLSYLLGHIVNFHPRYNQVMLLTKYYFSREDFPILTMQIDYSTKRIYKMHLQPIKKDAANIDFGDVSYPLSFDEFIDEIYKKTNDEGRINIYGDYLDDEWDFISKNIKLSYKDKITAIDIYDFARLFNYFDLKKSPGPFLEDVLEQFNIDFDIKELLSDCVIRGKKIRELIRMISLSDMFEKEDKKENQIFDSVSIGSKSKYNQDCRRSLKKSSIK